MNPTHPGRRARRSTIARTLALALPLPLALLTAACWPPDPRESGDAILIKDDVDRDLYTAGRLVEVRGDVAGDLTVAGQTVMVDAAITGDVLAAGDSVTLAGGLGDDVRAVGRTLRITGDVGDHVLAAGEWVIIGDDARVGGFARLAGSRVDVRGTIAGDAEIAGETVWILGRIDGDLRLRADEAVIAEGARIGGDLIWPEGHVPDIHPNARIDGRRLETARDPRDEPPGIAGRLALVLLGGLSLGLVSTILALAFPAFTRDVGAQLRARPMPSLGFGALAVLVGPLAAGLAIATVIGGLLGVVILLAYVMLLAVSVPTLLIALTDLARGRASTEVRLSRLRWIGLLTLASLVFAGLLQVPIVGPIVAVGCGLFGLGAIVLHLARRGITAPAGGMDAP